MNNEKKLLIAQLLTLFIAAVCAILQSTQMFLWAAIFFILFTWTTTEKLFEENRLAKYIARLVIIFIGSSVTMVFAESCGTVLQQAFQEGAAMRNINVLKSCKNTAWNFGTAVYYQNWEILKSIEYEYLAIALAGILVMFNLTWEILKKPFISKTA